MYRQTEFDAVRALETLGLGAATFLLLVLVVYRMGYGKWDRMGQLNWAAFCLSSLACESFCVHLVTMLVNQSLWDPPSHHVSL